MRIIIFDEQEIRCVEENHVGAEPPDSLDSVGEFDGGRKINGE